jgi:hypothetical protein
MEKYYLARHFIAGKKSPSFVCPESVILQPAKNLLFFFLIKKSKDEILRPSASG